MDELVNKVVSQIDINSVFVIQGGTALIKALLNVTMRTRYTDWMAPFVAVALGQLLAFYSRGLGGEAILYGLGLAGGAITFQTIWNKFFEGVSVITGKDKEDPVIQSKLEVATSDAGAQIEKIKGLLKKKE